MVPLLLVFIQYCNTAFDRHQDIAYIYEYSSFDVCILNEDFSGVETLYRVATLLVRS